MKSLDQFFTILIICILFFSPLAKAQGLVFNDAAYGELSKKPELEIGNKSANQLLENNHKVDLRPYCPTVKHQGQTGSCVGWSVGYAAMTIEKAIINNWQGQTDRINENAFSPMFLFNQIKINDCDFGSELDKAFEFIFSNGNVYEKDFQVSATNCDSLPSRFVFQKAKLNRISDFTTLFGPEDDQIEKVNKVKLSLIEKKPVTVGMIVRQNFVNLKSQDRFWYPLIGKTNLYGGHAMVVVGFDDGKKAFEVMNSWGETWGNNGFMWIKYQDFAEYCKYAYQLYFDQGAAQSEYFEARIKLLSPVVKSFKNNTILFSEMPLIGRNNIYRLKDTKLPLPFEFQILIETMQENSYIYVISFDQDLNAFIHWPRDEQTDSNFTGSHQTALIKTQKPDINIPGKYSLLSINGTDTEYVCILSSKRPIHTLNEKLAAIKTTKGALPIRMERIFRPHLIADKYISFAEDFIAYSAQVNQDQIIPILLEFDLKKK